MSDETPELKDYLVIRNLQLGVKAENADEALKKVLNGEGTPGTSSYNVQLRPVPVQVQQQQRTTLNA